MLNVESNVSYKFGFVTVTLTDSVIVRSDVNHFIGYVYCESIGKYAAAVVAEHIEYELVITLRAQAREGNRIHCIGIDSTLFRICVIDIQSVAHCLLYIRFACQYNSVGSVEGFPEISERIFIGQILINEFVSINRNLSIGTNLSAINKLFKNRLLVNIDVNGIGDSTTIAT